MKLVAIVGMAGSGKSELSSLFENRNFFRIRFGDITEEVIKKQGAEIREDNEKKVRESLRKQYGMEAYAKLNLPRIEDALKKGNVVVDGLYSWEEYQFLKRRFGNSLIVLAVYSPPNVRYERLNERETRPLTLEQARERDKNEIENLNKAAPIAMADYTLLNVGTLFDLSEKFEEFMEWLHEREEAK